MKQHINLLWTGGWDSTFRLCQLSQQNVEVQPVYFRFGECFDRKNEQQEIQAQTKILAILRQKPNTKASILDPVRLTEQDIPADPIFDAAFQAWNDAGYIPGQLRILGKLPHLYPNLEYCMEGPTLKRRQQGFTIGKTQEFLQNHGFCFIFHADGSATMDTTQADPQLALLWSGFTFPILGITEMDMVPIIRQWGYEDVFALTWTCDFNGKEPCGICHNCETKWASGLKDFFSPAATRNHKIKKYLEEKVHSHAPEFPFDDPGLLHRFEEYVHNSNTVVPLINPLTLPLSLQPLAATQKNYNTKLQTYFDQLIRKFSVK